MGMTGRPKWFQEIGQSAKMYPKPLKGFEDSKVLKLY